MSDHPPRCAELLYLKRQAFLLDQVASARDGKLSRTDANKPIPKQIQDELTLDAATAGDFRREMVSRGLLAEQKVKRSVVLAITEAGRTLLRDNHFYVPLRPAKGEVNDADDSVLRQKRVALLLLQLVDIPEGGHTPADLKKKFEPLQAKLKLNSATARFVRGGLADVRFIAVTRTARSEKYVLTEAGHSHLGTLSFEDFGKLTLSGSALTRLLRVARGSEVYPPDHPSSPRTPAPVLTPRDLEAAVLAASEQVRRDGNTKLAPICEVRAIMRQRYCEAAVSRDAFDECILELRRSKKQRVISISDKSSATGEQLRDSVLAVGEVFFYLENIDESASG